MTKILAGLLLGIFAIAANAEPAKANKPVYCFPIKTLVVDLKNKYGEEPMMLGKHGIMKDVGVSLYVNAQTGTFTMLEFDNEAGCVISSGTDLRYRLPKIGLDVN